MSGSDLVFNPTIEASTHLFLRYKNGTKRCDLEINRKQKPELYAFVAELLATEAFTPELHTRFRSLSEADQTWLIEQKIILPPAEVALDILFECPLDRDFPALMSEAVKAQLPALTPQRRAQFSVNPRMVLQQEADLDGDYAERVPYREVFSPRRPLLWVREPLYEMLVPYWPTPELLPIIESLLAGQIPSEISDETFHVLVLARILLLAQPQEYLEFQAQQAQRQKQSLAQERYVIFQQWLNPIQIAALRVYYRQIQAEGYLRVEDSKDVVRTYAHNDPFTCYLHTQMSDWVNRVTPEKVKPSYTFVSYYEQTGMGQHTDWEQCAWNISVMIDPQPEELPTLTWPLFIRTENLIEARLEPGDAIMYKGIEDPHWRDPLPSGHKATVSLFHFVDQDYSEA
jgi:hypothetical protein